ncbi:MAG TPA: hypothetical protein P5096_01040 [Patescibacteria group bacterium]|nr:hypothetical protein [Patescibacteria group bacterium]
MHNKDTLRCAAKDILNNPKELGRIVAAITGSNQDQDERPSRLLITGKKAEDIEKAAQDINKSLADVSALEMFHVWYIKNGIPPTNPKIHCYLIIYNWVYGGKKFRDEQGRFLEEDPAIKS